MKARRLFSPLILAVASCQTLPVTPITRESKLRTAIMLDEIKNASEAFVWPPTPPSNPQPSDQ